MPMFYCDHYNTNLTQDGPSVKEKHGTGGKHKEKVKAYLRKGWKNKPRAWATKQLLYFNKESYFLLLHGQGSHYPPVSWIHLTLIQCQYPIWRVLPWCQWWALLLLRWCQWDLLQNESAYGKLHASIARIPNDEISCPSRVASTSHVPMWQVMTQDQTDEELLFNSRTRKTCSSFLPKRE